MIRALVSWAACLILFAACGGTSVDDFSFGDLFSDDAASPFQIKNETGVDVVVFRNSLSDATKIGGIKSGYSYGMKRDKNIGGLYVLKAISSSDYQTAVESGTFANARVIDSMMVFITDTRTTNYIRNMSGSGAVRFKNKTGKYVEVFSGYWGEDKRVVLTPSDVDVVQYMPVDSYTFYSSVVLPQTNNGELVYLKRNNLTERPGGNVEASPVLEIDINPDPTPEYKYTYIHVRNNRATGASVMFLTGVGGGEMTTGTVMRSTLNHLYINGNGGIEVFQLEPMVGYDYRTFAAGSMMFRGVDFSLPINPATSMRFNFGSDYYFIVNETSVETNAMPF